MDTRNGRQRLQDITRRIRDLPTLPVMIARLMELVDDPKTSAAGLSRLISTDQALTVKLLKLANSSYYGFPRQISTISLAIVVLGFETVKHLGLSLSVIDRFTNKEEKELFHVARFWEHSIGCGIASGMLAKAFRYRVSAEVFVAGLLHDIGKVIINQYCGEDMAEILRMIEEEGCSFLEAEECIMDVTHPEIGRWLAEQWNLPPQLVDGIAFHHRPGEAENSPEVAAMVHLADILCRRAQIGHGGDETIPELDEQAVVILKRKNPVFDVHHLERYQEQLTEELEKSDMFMAIAKRSGTGVALG